MTNNEKTPLIIGLGAGITGLTAAWKLAQTYGNRVVLLEKEEFVGGLAATISNNGFSVDIGSHRLHEDCIDGVGDLIRELIGPNLLRRKRNGRIYVSGQSLPYPPLPLDFLSAFGISKFFRFCQDLFLARIKQSRSKTRPRTFEEFLTSRLGKSLYECFYRPYGLKLFGICPTRLAMDPAVSRLHSARLKAGLCKQVIRLISKNRPSYFYPSQGIGQLSENLRERFLRSGGRLSLCSKVEALEIDEGGLIREVNFRDHDNRPQSLKPDIVFSTIPLQELCKMIAPGQPGGPGSNLGLQWRHLRLLHLITPDRVVSDHETFYFPDPGVPFGRVSELNKYTPYLNQDSARAVLTLEIPCSSNDDVWTMPEENLAALCIPHLQRFGILRDTLSRSPEFFSMRRKNVYPLFDLDYGEHFSRVKDQLSAHLNLYVVGRSALYLHCNVDHCMYMGLDLARFLTSTTRIRQEWNRIQNSFTGFHVRE